jgi:tetratricopeptide (TPR) repeat protein
MTRILLGVIFLICALYPTVRGDSASFQDGEEANGQMKNKQQGKNSGEEHFYRANWFHESLGKAEAQAALREYKLAIEKGYDTVELRIQLGRLLAFRLDQPGEAVTHFRIALDRDPNNWRIHFPLAQILLQLQQYQEALKEIKESQRLDKDGRANGFYFDYLAKAYDGPGESKEALRYYRLALKRGQKVEPRSSKVKDITERINVLTPRQGR